MFQAQLFADKNICFLLAYILQISLINVLDINSFVFISEEECDNSLRPIGEHDGNNEPSMQTTPPVPAYRESVETNSHVIPTISATIEASSKTGSILWHKNTQKCDTKRRFSKSDSGDNWHSESGGDDDDKCNCNDSEENDQLIVGIEPKIICTSTVVSGKSSRQKNNGRRCRVRLPNDSKCDLSDKGNVDVTTPLINNSLLDDVTNNSKTSGHPSILTTRKLSKDCSGSLLRNRPGSILSIFNSNPRKDQVIVQSPSHERLQLSSSSPLPSPSISPINTSHHQHYHHHYPFHHMQKNLHARKNNSEDNPIINTSNNQTRRPRLSESSNQNYDTSNSSENYSNNRLQSTSSSSSGSLAQFPDITMASKISPYESFKKLQKEDATEVSIEMTPTLTRTISTTSNDTAGSALSVSEVSNTTSEPSNQNSSASSSPLDVIPKSSREGISPHSILSINEDSQISTEYTGKEVGNPSSS